jgi:glycosyltransferase involved in cell wall biosynthesis
MKVAMMVHGYISVPRPVDMVYSPIDIAVIIAEGLARRGHSVDFYAPLGSHFNDRRINVRTMRMRPLAHNQRELNALYQETKFTMDYLPALWDARFANDMLSRASRGVYDILHFHHPQVVLPYVKLYPNIPVVYTMHNPIYPWYRELFELYDSPNQHVISISNNQRRDAPDLRYLANIYNSTSTHRFTFEEKGDDYLLFVGRIVPEKGVKEAVQIARATGNRLLIIGPTYPDSQDYFDQYIKPFLNDKILYLGFIEHSHLSKYYQKAKALLAPIQWEEPFGLTTIEAMACGTPVISIRRGAAPEIIKNGKNGYLVNSVAEMIKAVNRIDNIDRRECRKHVKMNFSHDKMVDEYEKAFLQLTHPAAKIIRRTKYVGEQLKKVPQRLKRTARSAGIKDKGRGVQQFMKFK